MNATAKIVAVLFALFYALRAWGELRDARADDSFEAMFDYLPGRALKQARKRRLLVAWVGMVCAHAVLGLVLVWAAGELR